MEKGIEIECVICGRKFEVDPVISNIYENRICPECKKKGVEHD